MNDTFRIALRAMVMAAMTLLTVSTATAQVHVKGNVFGGGNLAEVGGSVTVNMIAGTVDKDVYGGGALANTNTSNTPGATTYTTTVNLEGGTIEGNAYGGGLGRKAKAAVDGQPAQGTEGDEGYVPAVPAQAAVTAVEALVYGNVTLKLNEGVDPAAKGCVVKGKLFGCNNVNGTPKGNVEVHVYATQSATTDKIQTKARNKTASPITGAYDVVAVYGGGNEAAYVPESPYNGTTGSKSQVIIEGCNYTSIETVYGGGNAAAVPESNVQVLGAYEIGYVYGGGNGKDNLSDGTANPGADIGQYNNNGTLVTYGTGIPSTTLTAGYIHEAYGGSNQKGVIKGSINLVTNPIESDATGYCCDLALEKVVGAGKYADIEGDVILVMGCMPESKTAEIFGGADEANVKGNVELTITSGSFGKVFGGNNLGGAILGHIIVNIEETGCRPIEIDELYLGGNEAAYSIYGYYDSGETNTVGKPVYLPRTAAMHAITDTSDENYKAPVANPTSDATHSFPYADPVLNVISATRIGKVFGGGLGSDAVIHGNPTVNINMIKGTATGSSSELGTIGDVYGGGNEAVVEGSTTVNIGTETTVQLHESYNKSTSSYTMSEDQTVLGANITGSVFGGGNEADVTGDTHVNICAEYDKDEEVYKAVAEGTAKVKIGGSVFGGGKGKDDTFECEKAMVGIVDQGIGSTNVVIGNGTVTGSVYGGGQIGRVEHDTKVMIGLASGESSAPEIKEDVFGAGKGLRTHGYAALVRGDAKVIVQGNAKVRNNVYGGGEIASVGRFNVAKNEAEAAAHGVAVGMPYELVSGGNSSVAIQGNAEIGPSSAMQMKKEDGPDDAGHVFGAGKGILPLVYAYTDDENKPSRMIREGDNHSKWEYFAGETAYIAFIETLALTNDTEVKIDGNALVKGSVYGGSENGHVREDTHVTIAGGQIGCGKNATGGRHDASVWGEDYIVPEGTDLECDSWDYLGDHEPYDIYKDSDGNGTPDYATDGHTFYGNVFGGGRGYYPYRKNPNWTPKEAGSSVDVNGYSDGLWLSSAGAVYRNTVVDITGGHILTSVYGGNELTNVTGSCTINMTGGTVGVPRTLDQMQGHPVTCSLYGAGKGDQRINFNTWTNVASTQVNISGNARIYGSTFGGGEDGHVLGNAETNIGGTITIGSTEYPYSKVIIGTTGTSGVDGNVFGGGRGFSETALTAGVVGGNVSVNIHNGTMLGTVFGGGRLASVGTNFADATNTEKYGKMQVDEGTDTHGHINITIDGGTIGATTESGALTSSNFTIGDVYGGGKGSPNNDLRFGLTKTTTITMSGGHVNGSVYGGGEVAVVEGNATITINGGEVGDCVTKKGGDKIGNVYGSGKGNLSEAGAGLVKGNTSVTIEKGESTTPTIYHNVYGGGSYGSVGDFTLRDDGSPGSCTSGGTAEITITGGTIGTDGDENGMVFGSSRGDVQMAKDGQDPNNKLAWVNTANVIIGIQGSETGPQINGSIYGSGENGHVLGNANVAIHSGTIGIASGTAVNGLSGVAFPNRGNVYGGGCGTDYFTVDGKNYFNKTSGIVRGNTTVTMDGGHVVRNIYGGGAMGSVGGYSRTTKGDDDPYKDNDYVPAVLADNATGICTVTISGGQVGVDGNGNGMVFAAGRGQVVDPAEYPNYDRVIFSNNTELTISGTATIKGSVYGGSESGHVWGDTKVTIAGGTVGSSVFGGGEAGYVRGGVEVNMTGGTVTSDVYGGGALASTQIGNWNETNGTWATGKTSVSKTTLVNLTGGTIGGDAYGGGLGRKEYGTEGQTGYVSPIAAMVYGDVTVKLNEDKTAEDKGCIVDKIFGCNNLNGTPKGKVKVYVYATQKSGESTLANKAALNTNAYDVQAVYGGGNLADYVPADALLTYNETNKAKVDAARPEVYIDGCSLTSIKQVYGGGNAAPAPATYVEINAAYEIDEVFGGGNGYDNYSLQEGNATVWYQNPGANVGYYTYATYPKGTGQGSGTEADPYKAVETEEYSGGAEHKENRLSTTDEDAIALRYGSGIATLVVKGGTVHTSYGGSNSKGNVRAKLSSTYSAMNDECTMSVDQSYGGGKNAYSDADVEQLADCAKGVLEMFGGAKDADIDGDINMVITNGSSLQRVFGGNNTSGAVNGAITVTIKEGGCEPIRIGELYAGGYLAPYSVYGYKKKSDGTYDYNETTDEQGNTIHERIPLKAGDAGALATPHKNPRINVISATYIGNIFGGGYKAKLVGNPHINVNMEPGRILAKFNPTVGDHEDFSDHTYTVESIEEGTGDGILPIGTIDNIYGGGNMADIDGDTYVEIGTGTEYDDNDELVEIIPARNAAEITGSVFGGGNHADVTGNTNVTMANGSVENRIFGGGNLGSVGVYTMTVPGGHSHEGDCIEKPTTCASGGTCNVTISGGRVGPTDMAMPQNFGYVFGASRGETKDPDVDPDINFRTYVNETHVTINGTAFITGGVYGGSENGRVLHDTYVTIEGGQIGCGEGKTQAYTTDEWSSGDPLIPTAHWPYKSPWTPYDEHAYDENTASKTKGTDGHTFYGNVFGGGSGYFPYLKKKTSDSDPDEYEWLPSAGLVEGDTHVTISGGHILTNVYGGNEMTDVSGTCHVTMTGGTIGVPRTVAGIQGHPVIGNLFGAGKGDQRVHFNKRTNVDNTEVSVTGGTIYGSIFGGGEDGHVMKNTKVTVGGDAVIGTWGYSGFDGNVFGGGRGFSGDALTAGNVGGTVEVNIEGGTMLGSVYGGGRLASVGYGLYNVDETGYGVMRDDGKDDAGNTVEGFKRGYVTVNISGGTIGNDTESTLTHTKGGNVYGGSMGRLTLIDGTTISPIWPKLAKVKKAEVNISGGTIKSNVYGGGELGTVHTDTKVIVTDGTINRDLFGGGYGSDDYTTTTDGYTPMQLAGRVDGTTTVEVNGGWVKKNVYGGGEMASVGVMTLGEKHESETTSFALSWPYASTYDDSNGNTSVTISGGRIGMTGKDKLGNKDDEGNDIKEDNGDVYGGGKGLAGDRYIYANCANVNNSTVLINYSSTPNPPVATDEESSEACIAGSVYGGGENGHVIGDTHLTMSGGLVGHALYGGGKGKDKFAAMLWKRGTAATEPADSAATIYSITAGKVYGNTNVTMSGGRVVRNIYGGGNMASVGKGNYSGGFDDYSTAGYGETLNGRLWSNSDFINSGKTTVLVSGGTVGAVRKDLTDQTSDGDVKDDLPFGNVFGGCRGEAAPDVDPTLSPRIILYFPEFFAGYVNQTEVTIEGGSVLGSVYGGGEDGHVRRSTEVNINGGTIGLAYTKANRQDVGAKPSDSTDLYGKNNERWKYRGNVFGAGSGIGQYDTGLLNNGKKIKAYSTSAGSVTVSTEVNINGGTVHRNVYGGGSLSSVGAPRIGQADPTKAQSLNTVNINGGTVGDTDSYGKDYGGNVYGASRGEDGLDATAYSTSMFTEVNMKSGSVIGSIFGGGEIGAVKHDTEVQLTGGTIGHDAFGGGHAAEVGGDATVELNKGVAQDAKGCVVGRVFGANDESGTPKGHVLVHVYATQNANKDKISDKDNQYDVSYVFGGGNKADYVPAAADTKQSTEVIIEGCNLTSIEEVYGGGYGAAVPATDVLIKGTKIIDNVFGGGYGAGADNPGANVGKTTAGSDYGTGKALVRLMAGNVHNVYGGSNTKGDIREGSSINTEAKAGNGCCETLNVDEIYGGGRNAAMYGGAEIVLGCMPNDWVGAIYAGAENADVHNDVSLTLTSGKFGRVFGGNNAGGIIDGYIEVNIEENPECDTPVIIGELYGGGNQAPYATPSGYGADYLSPRVNVRAFTSIGNIFGGGYGRSAVVTGNTSVTIDEIEGGRAYDVTEDNGVPTLIDGTNVRLYSRKSTDKMGVIGNVYGGGNAAKVNGNTNVTIGTQSEVVLVSTGETKSVIGADIRGNVYGGGNAADVSGKTNVVIGKNNNE